MRAATLISLALKSILNRRITALLTLFAVALSVLLFVGVEKVRQGARTSFERTVSGADLIVGARSGPINLLLYSVFRIGDATANMSWKSYETIAGDPEVEWAIPLSLGDAHRGYRVVGTDLNLFEHYRYGDNQSLTFADGGPFSDMFDVVLGAEVAKSLGYQLGSSITLSHGLGEVSFSDHEDKPFKVVGILKPTGTPIDRSLNVGLGAIEAIHVGWETGAKSPLANLMTAERVRKLNLQPDELTAMIIGLKSRPMVLKVQRDINTYKGEALLAVIPGVALGQLWETVGIVERLLSGISICVIAVGLVVILVSILTTLNERRREMAILRSVGASPSDVFFLLVLEAAALAFVGALAGLALLYSSLIFLAPVVQERAGVSLSGVAPDGFDLLVLGAVTTLSACLAAFPAWRAFRNALADGLQVRM
jgi:putative ABC transport system permease protein